MNRELGLLNLLGVIMFVPVGFLMPLALRLRFRRVVGACAALSAAVEMAQLAMGRSLDVDDVLLNTLGGVVGAAFGGAVAAWLRGVLRAFRTPHRPGMLPPALNARIWLPSMSRSRPIRQSCGVQMCAHSCGPRARGRAGDHSLTASTHAHHIL